MRLFVGLMHNTKLKFSSHNSACELKPSKKSLFEVCENIKSLAESKQIHAHILINGFENNTVLATKLVSMYAKCGSLIYARTVFDRMSEQNTFLWNALIGGYARNGFSEETLTLYYQMQQAGRQPDNFTFPSVLKACTSLAALQQGKEIHNFIIRIGFESSVFVGSALVDMYAKCGNIENARHVFDKMSERDVVSWNTIIAGYAQSGHCDDALRLFHQMELEGVKPDSFTIASVLPACGHLTDLQQGKEIHDYITRNGFESHIIVGNALIDMYTKCGSTDSARHVFDNMSDRDVVSWTTIIAGYVQEGHCYKALELFHQMQLAGVKPDSVIVTSVLPACARLAVLQQGKEIHEYIVRNGFDSDIVVGNALIDMYAKCGSIEDAHQQFDKMYARDVVSWNAIIVGYGINGYAEGALKLFHQMQQEGMKPNDITFVGVLSACSHAGLLSEGRQYFDLMSRDYHIPPSVDHYNCMVDLLGRAGHLHEAHDFIQKMPVEPDAGVWGALLGACRIHRNLKLGELVAERLLELEPKHPGYYVLLSNIYAASGRWDGVAKVRMKMKDMGLKKSPGCSWIDVKDKVHSFVVGENSHPQLEQLYAVLVDLAGRMREIGYVPDTNFALRDVEQEEKENILCGHSEKLAVAFGLINTCPRTTLRITKNLRVCGDCHTAIKFISKIVDREIIVRDANRFHHFQNGFCSCKDYW
eukprot:Gb_19299 [translate_table: standard]